VAPDPPRRYVDALSMGAEDVRVYEAVATVENTGKPVTRAQIAAIAGLDEQVLDRTLSRLTDRGVLVRTHGAGEPGYELASRGWRAAPPGQP
jgi:RIO-like serine/threonine protein kinase